MAQRPGTARSSRCDDAGPHRTADDSHRLLARFARLPSIRFDQIGKWLRARSEGRAWLKVETSARAERVLRSTAGRPACASPDQWLRGLVRHARAAAMTRVPTVLLTILIGYSQASLAYRPFDSTDADVAHAGEVEIELGPAQWLRERGKRFLQAPAL